jgi:hypothetical protein
MNSGTMPAMTPSYFVPGHFYYDHAGSPIELLAWAELCEGDRKIVHENDVTLPGGQVATLRTVHLGFVDPGVYDARLFGTALIVPGSAGQLLGVEQLDVWDTADEAAAGHALHLVAAQLGFHCARCRNSKEHAYE